VARQIALVKHSEPLVCCRTGHTEARPPQCLEAVVLPAVFPSPCRNLCARERCKTAFSRAGRGGRALAALLLALAIALGAAGCGDTGETDAKNEYVTRVAAIQDRLAAALGRARSDASDPVRLRSEVRALRTAVGRAADELDAVRPPPAVGSAHDRLAAVLRGYGRRLRQAAAGAAQASTSRRLVAAQLVVTSTADAQAQFDRAIAEINRRIRR